uniref:Uncharacterized protein n=1 Tax=Sphaerodactylus townsendi TaxID=933632 RepID=A0ACB8GED4_9SAUR
MTNSHCACACLAAREFSDHAPVSGFCPSLPPEGSFLPQKTRRRLQAWKDRECAVLCFPPDGSMLFPTKNVRVLAKEHETKQTQKGRRVGFVLVHAGAGYHSESKAKEYKHVCKRACRKAIEKLQAGALVTDAVTAALVELEVQ